MPQVDATNRIQPQSNLNSYVHTGTTGDHSKAQQDSQLQSWQKGEIIEGKIISANDKTVTLEVDGKIIEAKLEGNFEFISGEKVRLTVTNSNLEKLLLKPMLDNLNLSEKRLEDILKSLQLKINPQNKDMVQELMGAKLPLSSENLKILQMMMIKYPDINIRSMVLLMKNNIPITDENLQELMKTQTPKDMLATRLNQMVSKLLDVLKTTSGEEFFKQLAEGNTETEKVLSYLKSMVTGKDQAETQGNTRLLTNYLNREEIEDLAKQIENLLKNNLNSKNLNNKLETANLNNQDIKLAQSILTEIKQGILKQDIQSLQNILNKSQDLPKELQNDLRILLSERLSIGALRKGLFLNGTEDDPIKHLEHLYEKLVHIKGTDDESSMLLKNILQDVVSAKDSMNFMAKFQNNASFLQLPFLMGEQVLNGELFVLKNKKDNSNQKRDKVSALLQLDFLTLGHLDTFIRKDGNKIQIDFYAEDHTKEKWIKEKIHLLHNKLMEKNYQILALNTFVKKDKTDGFANFLANEEVQKVSRFSFDMRA